MKIAIVKEMNDEDQLGVGSCEQFNSNWTLMIKNNNCLNSNK